MSAGRASMGVTFTTVHTHHTRFHPTIKTQSLTHCHLPTRTHLIKLPAAGSDKYLKEDKGPEAGDRYKKAKYGGDSDDDAEEESAGGKSKKKVGVAAVIANARSDEEVLRTSICWSRSRSDCSARCFARYSARRASAAAAAALRWVRGEKQFSRVSSLWPVRALSSKRSVHPAARGALPRAAVHHETRRV